MRRVCLHCEGTGVIRNYLDRAGLYEKSHCSACKGTGLEPKPTDEERCASYQGLGNCGAKGCLGHGDF